MRIYERPFVIQGIFLGACLPYDAVRFHLFADCDDLPESGHFFRIEGDRFDVLGFVFVVEIDVRGHVGIEDLSADGFFLIGNLEHLDVLTHDNNFNICS